MSKTIAFIVITCLVLSFNNQINGTTVPLADSRAFRCMAFNGSLFAPNSPNFSTLNQTNFEVTLSGTSRSCIYLFVATNIEIQLGDVINDPVDISDYLISYRLNTNLYSMRLSEFSISTTRTNRSTNVTIDQIIFEEMTIARFINTSDNFRVRYEIRGFTTPRVTVSSYLIQQPNFVISGDMINIDDTYNGMCNGEVCYGGRGQLMDGVIGGQSDTSASEVNVGWRCFVPNINCTFPLRILLSGQAMVTELTLYGYNTSSRNVPPTTTVIQPINLPTVPILRGRTENTYSVNIPINRFTDEIILEMIISVGEVLLLSEVEVISNNNVNIALLAVEYRSSIFLTSNDNTGTTTQTVTSSNSITFPPNVQSNSSTNPITTFPTNTPSTTNSNNGTSQSFLANQLNKVPLIIFPLIITGIFLMLLVAIVCCIILFIKYRSVKKTLTKSPTNNMLVQLSATHDANEERERYSSRMPNHDTLYATIGPEATLDPKTNLEIKSLEPDFNKNRTGTYVRNEELFDNPVYAGDGIMLPANETLDTKRSPLESPTGHFNMNFQMDAAPSNGKDFEKSSISKEKQEHGMNENPLYKDTEVGTDSYTQLVINGEEPAEKNREGFPSYDFLKH